ncbi:unnamed protein product [Prorocentrum cordatum]|uniref:Solute carrier family 40 protein n=1 Tax=Prorocentrum cordatum TaxID=2364126 RepID=A0ABN9Q6P7_9DINO|nr:unnamed protein product [Polarella glacialis]
MPRCPEAYSESDHTQGFFGHEFFRCHKGARCTTIPGSVCDAGQHSATFCRHTCAGNKREFAGSRPLRVDKPRNYRFIDPRIRDLQIKKWGDEWNDAGGDRAFIVTYSNPHSAWLFLHAAVQLLVAVSGLGNHIRKQRRISFMATAVVCVHIFLDALLTIGCFVILFAIMPGQDRVMTSEKETMQLFASMVSGSAMGKMLSVGDILMFGGKDRFEKAETFYQTELFPFMAGQFLETLKVWFDFVGGLHSPDLVLEKSIFVKVMVGGVILYGVLRALTTAGGHVLFTSPAVLLNEERAEPVSLVFQMAVKTAAVSSPYIIAASSWIEFQVVIATMFGVLIQSRFTYYAMLGIYFAIFAMSGIAAVALLRQDDGMAGDGRSDDCVAGDSHGEELHNFPLQQRCCAGHRKQHKLTFDITDRPAADMEQGAGQGLLGQLAPSYGGCETRTY